MKTWLLGLWTDEAKFERAVRGIMIGLGMAAISPQGVELLGPWSMLAAIAFGGIGGITAAGTAKLTPYGQVKLEQAGTVEKKS